MNIVIAGHVDHGKSTIIGRLFADTHSLPQGKLEQIREYCRRNSKPFEYAFLLDALKDERAQGITIDSARCFFKTKKRHYTIIDAPGHVEFLKNMISGASRAEAALLVIDANEGIQENSKRHGYLLSMLGIKQICVLVNKMDLVDYNENIFKNIVSVYSAFLEKINVFPSSFIPVSGMNGDNIAEISGNMKWYTGLTVLDTLDRFIPEDLPKDKPFRMPVQDVYKFTEKSDTRRIIAGTIESGEIHVGDEVVFFPSGKKSRIASIEAFNKETQSSACAGFASGFTLQEQIYVKRGELAVLSDQLKPCISSRIKVTLFWLGKHPMKKDKIYYFKLGTAKVEAKIEEIENITDASTLESKQKDIIERHDVAECILKLNKEIAFDLASDIPQTGRFVLVDNYEISGGGIIHAALEDKHDSYNDRDWPPKRKGTVIWFTGLSGAGKTTISVELEKELIKRNYLVYRLDGDNMRQGLCSDLGFSYKDREENNRRIAEVASLFKDTGFITLVSLISPLKKMRESARKIIGAENFTEVYIKASLETCMARDPKGLYKKAASGQLPNFTGISSVYEESEKPDLIIDTEKLSVNQAVDELLGMILSKK